MHPSSFVDHYQRRLTIRQTWGNPNTFATHFQIRVLFLIGMRKSKTAIDTLQEALQFESEQYGDLLQEDYIDSYQNLTIKGLSALRFISLNCQHVPYILKTDDDTFVNMFGVIDYLQIDVEGGKALEGNGRTATRGVSSPAVSKLLACLVWDGMGVVRDEKSKWYISKQEWEEDIFPRYCSGLAYLMSNDVAQSLFRGSFYTPFFWVDDLYITGLLPMYSKQKHRPMKQTHELNFSKFEKAYREDFEKASVKLFSHVQKMDTVRRHWIYIGSKYKDQYLNASSSGMPDGWM